MDDRKLKVLAAVVDEYVRTGEPVGSKAIAGLAHINVSAATVRNDMAVKTRSQGSTRCSAVRIHRRSC